MTPNPAIERLRGSPQYADFVAAYDMRMADAERVLRAGRAQAAATSRFRIPHAGLDGFADAFLQPAARAIFEKISADLTREAVLGQVRRQAPRDCQAEPPYPGLEGETVVFSIRAPEFTCHVACDECGIEGPHDVSECGMWR